MMARNPRNVDLLISAKTEEEEEEEEEETLFL